MSFMVAFFPSCRLRQVLVTLALLYQNNLKASNYANHVGFFLLDEFDRKGASEVCASVDEHLLSRASMEAHHSNFL